MRPGSPATYECKRSQRGGMHRWQRSNPELERSEWLKRPGAETAATCSWCGLTVFGEDAKDIFRGAETPIGQVRLGRQLLASRDDEDED